MKTIDSFIGAYENLENLRREGIPLPAVKEASYYDVVLRLGKRGMSSKGDGISWGETVDYLLKNLRHYLKDNWESLMTFVPKPANGKADPECQAYLLKRSCLMILEFLKRRTDVMLFMGAELIKLLGFIVAHTKISSENYEEILTGKTAESILDTYSFSAEILESLKSLAVIRLSSGSYADFEFFQNWLPKWWKKYPDVKILVAARLNEMKQDGKYSFLRSQGEHLYKLYCL